MADPAKLLNEYGDVVTDIGNAFMDDAATSTQTEGGAIRVLETSGDFFEFMNGKLNMTKTLVAILMYDSKGQLKRKAQPGEVWSAEHHIPDKILVVNKVVRQQVKDLEYSCGLVRRHRLKHMFEIIATQGVREYIWVIRGR